MLYIFGDTHAEWAKVNEKVNKFVQKSNENIDIIVVGDFGYWPNEKEYSLENLKTFNGKVQYHFCPGNHEHWWVLNKLEVPDNKCLEVYENIFYYTFGAVKNINGENFLFCGGADSIDKGMRTMGIDWFPEETISISDMYSLPSEGTKIDVVISHTCPDFVHNIIGVSSDNYTDPSCAMLTQVYEMFTPKKWYFGHFHMNKEFVYQDTKFICLNHISSTGKSYEKY